MRFSTLSLQQRSETQQLRESPLGAHMSPHLASFLVTFKQFKKGPEMSKTPTKQSHPLVLNAVMQKYNVRVTLKVQPPSTPVQGRSTQTARIVCFLSTPLFTNGIVPAGTRHTVKVLLSSLCCVPAASS